MKILVVAVSLVLLTVTNAVSEQVYFKTVKIDGKYNCAIYKTKKWNKKSIEIHLPPGKYRFVPIDGAISVYPKDRVAHDQGENPWSWYAIISVDGDRYELGSLAKYKTPRIALKEQKDDQVLIVLEKESIIRMGTEDIYKGKDYCSDNRGTETMGIIKEYQGEPNKGN